MLVSRQSDDDIRIFAETCVRGLAPAAFSRVVEVPFQGERLSVIGREDFIAMKLFAHGPQYLVGAGHDLDLPLLKRLAGLWLGYCRGLGEDARAAVISRGESQNDGCAHHSPDRRGVAGCVQPRGAAVHCDRAGSMPDGSTSRNALILGERRHGETAGSP
jgi:hypothetical protein